MPETVFHMQTQQETIREGNFYFPKDSIYKIQD